MLKPGCCFP